MKTAEYIDEFMKRIRKDVSGQEAALKTNEGLQK